MQSAFLNQIEQIVHRLREGSIKSDPYKQASFKSQLAAMAADPKIQSELQKIDQEFAVTEADGLEFELEIWQCPFKRRSESR